MVYVDNLLVKSKEASHHITDLWEAFVVLRKYKMKHNQAKCAFGIESNKFLSFMVSLLKIEANPKKIKEILEMKPL